MDVKFLNRKSELNAIHSLLKETSQGSRIIHCSTRPAAGLSSFFKHASGLMQADSYSFYIDGEQNMANSLSSQILISLYKNYPDDLLLLKQYVLHKYPNDARHIVGSFFSLIPFAGSFLKDLFKEIIVFEDIPTVQNTIYNSIVDELICPFLFELSRKKPVIFFVDNAQSLDDWSVNIFRTTMSTSVQSVKFILGFVNRKDSPVSSIEEIMWKLKSTGAKVYSFDFKEPDQLLVKELLDDRGTVISDNAISQLLLHANSNIYKILSYIKGDGIQDTSLSNLSKFQKEVISILSLASQPLRKNDITAIILKSGMVFIENEISAEREFVNLSQRDIIEFSDLPDTDTIVKLKYSSNPGFDHFLQNESENLVRSSNVYEYFLLAEQESPRYAQTEMALLLYRLAKLVDPSNLLIRGQMILALSIKMGSAESAKKYVDKAVLSARSLSINDFFIKVAFHIAIREYGEALQLLIDPLYSEWRDIRSLQVLKAVCYNRCRMHKESEQLIKELINTCIHREELALLLAYQIVGYLHENKVEMARNIYYSYNSKVKYATNYGYFLRNAAAVLPGNEGDSALNEAVDFFSTTSDHFGKYSTLANLGKNLCQRGEYEIACNYLTQASEHMAVYGFHHMHIVTNNLGLCKMYMQENQSAKNFFNKARFYAHNKMPLVYSCINDAALDLVDGEPDQAYQKMQLLEKEVHQFTFDRVRQKYFINKAFIAFATSQSEQEILDGCAMAEKYPDRSHPEKTMKKIELIKTSLAKGISYRSEMFDQLFDACFLEYWYQNPLESIPIDALSLKTIL